MPLKFTVFICNYNYGRYLSTTIESVLRQTYSDWELILVDDASTDDSLSIMQNFAKEDPRIVVVPLAENKGIGYACKMAVEKSSGVLLGKLDADDALTDNALEVMSHAHAEHPEASLIYSAHFVCDIHLKPSYKSFSTRNIPKGKSMIEPTNMCVSHFAAFKRQAYDRTEGFDPFFKKAVDQDLYLKLEETGEFVFINQPLYFYRNNPAGISRGKNAALTAQYHFFAIEKAYLRRQKTGFMNVSARRLALYSKMTKWGIWPSDFLPARIAFFFFRWFIPLFTTFIR